MGSGEAQEPDLTCSLDHVGGRWFLGLAMTIIKFKMDCLFIEKGYI